MRSCSISPDKCAQGGQREVRVRGDGPEGRADPDLTGWRRLAGRQAQTRVDQSKAGKVEWDLT